MCERGTVEPDASARCADLARLYAGWFRSATKLPRGSHRVEHARDNLLRSRAIHVVHGLGFEQLGVRQDDAQLVVQPVEERAQLRVHLRHVIGRVGNWREIHAWRPAVLTFAGSERSVVPASRHNVSANIRIEPPAVRTYSTLPAAIQL